MTLYRKFICFILIYLISNNKSVFVQSADTSNEPESGTEGAETQITATELKPEEYPQDIKLFKADPNDANSTVELGTSEYKVKKDGDDHVYEFENGVNCSLIKIEDKEVWKYDSSKPNAKYPKRVEAMTENLDAEEQAILIIFDGYTEIYDKDGDNWNLCATVKRELNKVQTGGKRADGTSSGGGTDQSSDGSGATHTGAENADSKSQVTIPSADGDASSSVAEQAADGSVSSLAEEKAEASTDADAGDDKAEGAVAGSSTEEAGETKSADSGMASGETGGAKDEKSDQSVSHVVSEADGITSSVDGDANSGPGSSAEDASETTDSELAPGKGGDDINVSSGVTSSGPDADGTSGSPTEANEGNDNDTGASEGTGTGQESLDSSSTAGGPDNDKDCEKEASAEADGSSGSAPEDAGLTAGGDDADGTRGSPPLTGGSTTHTGGGDGTGASGESEDASSQPSGGTDLTRDPDGSPSGSPEAGGSSPISRDSSDGDDTSGTVNPDRGQPSKTATGTVKKTPFELDIKKSSGTNEFDYKKDSNVVTFTAKDNYAFNVVKQDNTEIWRTDNVSEYAIKVLFNNKSQRNKEVRIYLLDGTNKSYKKDGWFKPWNEVVQSSDQTSSTTPGSGSGQTSGSPATALANTDENTTTVDIKKAIDLDYISDPQGCILTFTPRGGHCFNEVKEDNFEIWKTDKKDEYSKKVIADFGKNIVTIHLGSDGNSKKVFKKGDDNTWKEDNSGQGSTGSQQAGREITPASPTSNGTTCMDASGESTEFKVGESGSLTIETSESTDSASNSSLPYEPSTSSGSSETGSGSSGWSLLSRSGGASNNNRKKESKQQSGYTASRRRKEQSKQKPGSISSGSSGLLSGGSLFNLSRFGGSFNKSEKDTSKEQSASTSRGSSGIGSFLSGWTSSSRGGAAETSAGSDADANSVVTLGEAGDNVTTNGGLVAGYGFTGGVSYGNDQNEDMASNLITKEADETLKSEENEKDSEEEADNEEGNDKDGKDEEASCKKEKEDEVEEEDQSASPEEPPSASEAASEDENEETEESLHIAAKSSEPTDQGLTDGKSQVAEGPANGSGTTAPTCGGDDGQISQGEKVEEDEDSQGGGSSSSPADGAIGTPGLGATATTSTNFGTKTGVELDIKKSSGTNEFDYKKDGNVVTFTAKDNYAFNVVKQDNTEIWRTDNVTEFVTEVVLNGKGKKDKIVTIYFPDNTKKSYKKDKNNPWREYTGPLPSTGNAESSDGSEFEINIKKDEKQSSKGKSPEDQSAEGESHGGKTPDGRSDFTKHSKDQSEETSGEGSVEDQSADGGSAQAKPSKQPISTGKSADGGSTTPKQSGESGDDSENENYKLEAHGIYKTYIIKSGKKCTLVKVEDKEVWKYDSSNCNGEYPKMIWCEKYEKLYVGFNELNLAYEKGSDGNWKESKIT